MDKYFIKKIFFSIKIEIRSISNIFYTVYKDEDLKKDVYLIFCIIREKFFQYK